MGSWNTTLEGKDKEGERERELESSYSLLQLEPYGSPAVLVLKFSTLWVSPVSGSPCCSLPSPVATRLYIGLQTPTSP